MRCVWSAFSPVVGVCFCQYNKRKGDQADLERLLVQVKSQIDRFLEQTTKLTNDEETTLSQLNNSENESFHLFSNASRLLISNNLNESIKRIIEDYEACCKRLNEFSQKSNQKSKRQGLRLLDRSIGSSSWLSAFLFQTRTKSSSAKSSASSSARA